MPLSLALAGCVIPGVAQTPPASGPEVLITTTFVTPMTYAAALDRLDGFYDEQVGRKRQIAFPEIAPNQHFEVWHEMWAVFESPEDRTRVTLKKPSDAASASLAKSWMLDIAGRLNAALPLVFREEPGLRTVGSEIYTSRRDLAAIVAAQPAFRSLETWRHSGLFVSAEPLTKIALSTSALHGARQLTVTTLNLPSAKSLMAKLQQAAAAPGICGAFSEEVELDAEIHDTAQNRNDAFTNAAGTPTLYHPQMDLKYVEERIRSDPGMQKRIAAARGNYDVRFRVDRAYRKVTLAWSELTGYAAANGSFEAARDLGQTSLPNARKLAPGTLPTVARVHLAQLKTGAFRVRLSGEGMAGEAVTIDERTFWFDGKTFEEPQYPGQ
ncbi:MAG TPA: hypothetical protein VNY05_44855 [Candidatus Acidoferrales bacterium]|nr:hypothetical protein [Candidatus Acidoferrales bacterium]